MKSMYPSHELAETDTVRKTVQKKNNARKQRSHKHFILKQIVMFS